MQERWAEIEDFPDYAVSTHGRIFNTKYNRELKPRLNSYGYARVTLRRDSISYEMYIHHLVAKAFTTGYRDGVSIYHIDDDNSNNHILNLRFSRDRGLGQFNRKHSTPSYRRIKVVETGYIFKSVEDCARHLSGDPSTIYRVLRGERNSHKGYTFEYFYEGD